MVYRHKAAALYRASVSALAVLSVFTLAQSAQAQQASPPPAAGNAADNANPAQDNSEIIVTAQKTSQSASKVSQALSVFSGDQLKSLGVVNVSGLQNSTPGLEIGWASRGVSLSVRGVTTTDSSSKGQQDIVFSVDDIPVGRPQLMGLGFFDLDRVEVLRGPQGTLYGLSSTGGAINVITAKPTHQFEASASAEVGNYNTRRFTAMLNVPVTDTFALRGAVTTNNRDGFIKPTLLSTTTATAYANGLPNSQANMGGEDNWEGRVTGKLDIGSSGSLVVTNTFGHIGGANDTNTILYGPHAGGRFDVYYNPMVGAYGHNDHFWNLNASLNFDLGAVHVAYDGAHDWWHGLDGNNISVNNPDDNGAFNWERYDSDVRTDSHELRLSNADAHARLEWLVGGSYFNEHNYESDVEWQSLLNSTGLNPASATNGPAAGASCLGSLLTANCSAPNPQIIGPTVHRAEGVFGQTSYHATDKLKLTVGLRYSWDYTSRDATLAGGNAPGGAPWLTASGVPCSPLTGPCANTSQVLMDQGSNNTRALTYHVGVDYQITPADLFYASVSTGYKGGGFNDYSPITHATSPYGAERVTAYEAGFKGKILPDLRYTTAVYYYDYGRYQLTGATLFAAGPTGTPNVLIYTTLAPATMYGWENELEWRPSRNDTFNVSLSLERAFFNHGANQAQVGFLQLNQIPWGGHWLDRVPGASSTVSYEHRFDLANGANVKFRANSKISSGYWLTDFQGSNTSLTDYLQAPSQYRQGAYTRTDLNLGYTTANGKLQVEAFVKNIENKVQLQSAPTPTQSTYVQDGGRTVQVNQPRMFGARLTVKY